MKKKKQTPKKDRKAIAKPAAQHSAYELSKKASDRAREIYANYFKSIGYEL